MAAITKEQILASRNTRKTELVHTDEWGIGSYVIIIELSGKERDAFEAGMIEINGVGRKATQKLNPRNVRARLVARCIVNPDDFDVDIDENVTLKQGRTPTRMFNDIEANDLGDVSGVALDRVFERCQRLSGIRGEDIEELVGDLKNELSADFGSN